MMIPAEFKRCGDCGKLHCTHGLWPFSRCSCGRLLRGLWWFPSVKL